MTHKFNVLIPDGESEDLPLKVLRCLGEVADIKVSILSSEPFAPTRFSRYCTDFHTTSVENFDKKRLDIILETAKKVKADIVLPVRQASIRLIAENIDEVTRVVKTPPLSPLELIDSVANKWLFSKILQEHSIPSPQTTFYDPESLTEQDISHFSFPVLAKPRDGKGGTGIVMVKDSSELLNLSKTAEYADNFVIQEFIKGYDITCSIFSKNGEILAYTIQKGVIPGNKPFEPNMGIEFIKQDQVLAVIQKLIRSLNWSGVACFDLRLDLRDNEPKVLEMNPRYWGSLLGSLAAGVNFPYLACLTGLNIPFPTPEYKLIRYIKPELSTRLLIKQIVKGDKTLQKFHETGLSVAVRDPIPEVHKQITRMTNKFGRKIAKLLSLPQKDNSTL